MLLFSKPSKKALLWALFYEIESEIWAMVWQVYTGGPPLTRKSLTRFPLATLPADMFGGTILIIKILKKSLLSYKCRLIFIGIRKKKFEKIKFKMADSKKGHFSKSPILNIFLWKFHGAVLGLVEFIDAKGIGMTKPIWPWGCPT